MTNKKSKKIKVIKLKSSNYNKTRKHKLKIHNMHKNNKMHKNNNMRNMHKNNKYNKNGGEAISAGSYGCVFKPSIKCANNEPIKTNQVSKLMYNDESVIKEKEEMDNVKEIIKTIPNNEKYFLVMDTSICDPDKLTDEDLKSFDEKCDLFTENGITSKNVNSNLKNLKLINMIDGGIDIDDYISNLLLIPIEREKYISFMKINSSLIELLNNGIVHINKNGLNHMDIKGNNMLVDSLGHVRLIDWGLSSKNDGVNIPDEVTDHTFHFNNPFSNLFYNNFLKEWLPLEYKKIKASSKLYNSKSGQSELLKIVAVNMVNQTINYKQTGGHYTVIVSILHYIYKIYALDNGYNTIDYNVLIQTTIIEYIQSILLAYVDDNGNFKDVEYFYDVFSPNVDIWGFLMGYIYIIEKGVVYENNNNVKYLIHKDILNGICRILIKYCYSTDYATKAINVSELSKELESLNTISKDLIKQPVKIKGDTNQMKKTLTKKLERVTQNGILVEDIS